MIIRDMRLIHCDDTVRNLLGLTPDEVVGKSIGEVLGLKAADFQAMAPIEGVLNFLASSAQDPIHLEPMLLRPQRRRLLFTLFPIPAGPEGATVLLVREVNDDAEVERQHNATTSLPNTELRNPITIIIGFTELLLIDPALSPTHREWLETIRRASRRLAEATSMGFPT